MIVFFFSFEGFITEVTFPLGAITNMVLRVLTDISLDFGVIVDLSSDWRGDQTFPWTLVL